MLSDGCVCLASPCVIVCEPDDSGGYVVCSSFSVSLCVFTVSKALLVSSATVMVCAGGALATRVSQPWVCLVCLQGCMEVGISLLAITER